MTTVSHKGAGGTNCRKGTDLPENWTGAKILDTGGGDSTGGTARLSFNRIAVWVLRALLAVAGQNFALGDEPVVVFVSGDESSRF